CDSHNKSNCGALRSMELDRNMHHARLWMRRRAEEKLCSHNGCDIFRSIPQLSATTANHHKGSDVMKIPMRRTSWTLLFTLMTLWLPVAPVHAAMVTTDQISVVAQSENRDRVRSFLQREDVRNILEQQGVNATDALTRVDAMTDTEIQTVAAQLDQLPAGAGVVGVLFAVFVILLVTDILGLTKVFPFTRAVR